MTKKHLVHFAKLIASVKNQYNRVDQANLIITVAGNHDPRFDTERFCKSCEVGYDPISGPFGSAFASPQYDK